MAGSSHDTRPTSGRKPLSDGTHRANAPTASQRFSKSHVGSPQRSSGLPHHESLIPNNPLTVRNITSSPENKHHGSAENKRLSAVTNEDQPDSKRSSQVSTVSTATSSKGSRGPRRKTHIGPWQLGRDIGQGASCKVRKVRHSLTGQDAAVKIISKKIAEKARSESLANLHETAKRPNAGSLATLGNVMPFGIEREVVILKLLEHPNVVRLYDVWENRNQLYLIMEYVDGGELFDYVSDQECLSEDETVWLFRQMTAALLHCHRLGIHHRDLKPENILVETTDNSLRVKLADFGMAALQPKGKQLTTACGSVHYAAPEVFEKKYDGSKVDVWSLGIILYVMLTGTTPFTYDQQTMANNVNLWYSVIKAGEFPMPDELSHEAKDLIRKMLNPSPRSRITLDTVWNHPFVHKYEAEWGESTESGKLDNWIGPRPIIENWNVTSRDDIDREILRNLRTLWHSEKEEVLIERILSKEPNQEKFFYSALQRHRDEQLENYVGNPDGIYYSASDYHHIKPAEEISPPPKNAAVRTKSQFSILNDEHLQSRNSMLEPPPSTQGSVKSYDPFRASRDAIIGGNENYTSVVVRRGTSQHSKRSDTNSVRHPTSLRVEALKKEGRRLSAVSSQNSLRHSSPSSRPKTAPNRCSLSKSSLGSSVYASSPSGVVRPNTKHKRAVNFPHVRRSSNASANTTQSVAGAGTIETQDTNFASSKHLRESSSTSAIPPIHVLKIRRESQIEETPRSKLRKSQTDSQVIDTEARKVSTELEKLCEEVFNRSSADSSHRTSAAPSQGPSDTPPSSVSNARSVPSLHDSNPSGLMQPPNTPAQRPLPVVPAETPNTFIARELAETSKRLAARYAEDSGAQTDHYFEVLAHLEQINAMLKSATPTISALERRIASAPEPKFSDFSSSLPVISEDKLLDTADSFGQRRSGTRASSNPVEKHRGTHNEPATTIRVVDLSSPTRPAPLVIRKTSKDSLSAQSSITGSARSRSHIGTLSQPMHSHKPSPTSPNSLDTISEEPALKMTGQADRGLVPTKKKHWWKRRYGSDTENALRDTSMGSNTSGGEGQRNGSSESQSTRMKSLSGSKGEETVMSGALQGEDAGLPGKRPGFLRFFGKKKVSKRKGRNEEDDEEDGRGFSAIVLSPTTSGFREQHSLEPVEPYDSRDLGVQRNWLARFLHIKPAVKVLCFQVTRGRARAEIVRLLNSWRPHGIRDVVLDRERNLVFGRLDAINALGIKEVEFVIELYVVLERGKRKGLSIGRFTQRKGAASSFRRVLDEIETRLTGKKMLIADRDVRKDMEAILGG